MAILGVLIGMSVAITGCAKSKEKVVTNPTTLRVATFNVSMEARNYESESENFKGSILVRELQSASNTQIHHIAEIIQRVRPDIVLLNEFDNTAQAGEAEDSLALLQKHYLAVAHQDAEPITYPYHYRGQVNTGVLLPQDIDGDGKITAPADTYGFGFYPGHYGMVLLSRYPIDEASVRSFRQFLWADMPDAARPKNPDGTAYYTDAVWPLLRLSSKSHWDVPVQIGGQTLHILASHPTPPVFDGPEDRNGARNHDELRLWIDYLSGGGEYLYDDQGGRGALDMSRNFVLLGDLNASAVEGDGRRDAIARLLALARVQDPMPTSTGAREARPDNKFSANHTASWGMRADYVLPSSSLKVGGSGVFWPAKDEPLQYLVEDRKSSSDHRLVWVDISFD
jgi:endonuclease/exonuclease/phosphatase family metal-dependent hydrolase